MEILDLVFFYSLGSVVCVSIWIGRISLVIKHVHVDVYVYLYNYFKNGFKIYETDRLKNISTYIKYGIMAFGIV